MRRTWNLRVEGSSPGRCTQVVFLGKTLNSHSASPHAGVKVGTSKLLGDNLTKCWEVTCDGLVSHPGGVEILLVASYYTNLQWTSIPSRESRNTPSRFILH